MTAEARTTGATLLRQVSLYGAFTILRRGLNVALTPLYTHYLSPADFGVLEILNLSAWLASIIGACKVDAAFYRYYVAEKTEDGRAGVLGASLLLTLMISSVIVVVAMAGLPLLTGSVSHERSIPAVDFYIIGLSTWLDLATLVPLGYCRITDRVGFVGAVSITQALVSGLLAVAGVVYFDLGYRAVILANLAGTLGAALICAFIMFKAKIRFTMAPARALLKYGLPMFPGTLFMYVIGSADRFFLAGLASLGAVGVYAVAAKFATGVTLIVMAPFGEMWAANQYRLHASNDHRLYRKTALAYVAILFQFALGVAYFSYEFVTLALGQDFHAVATLVPTLVFGVAVWGMVPVLDLGSLVVPGKTWIRSAATGAAAGTNVLLNILLVPRYGAQGAALANVGGFAVLSAVTGALSMPLVEMRVPLFRLIAMVMTLGFASLLPMLSDSVTYSTFLTMRVVVFLAVGALYYHLSWGSEPDTSAIELGSSPTPHAVHADPRS